MTWLKAIDMLGCALVRLGGRPRRWGWAIVWWADSRQETCWPETCGYGTGSLDLRGLWGDDRGVVVCREDAMRDGTCYCGKLLRCNSGGKDLSDPGAESQWAETDRVRRV